jgi:LytS/YehU family sensor histidine kinase
VVLQSSKHDFISLEDELKFLMEYWNLLKVRFRDAIQLKVNIPSEKHNLHIPPLSLQFLVENAVKHNQASKNSPLLIEIMAHDNSLIVNNKITPKSYPVEGEKVGLKNLQHRFQVLHQPIEYGEEKGYFVVRLPLKTV